MSPANQKKVQDRDLSTISRRADFLLRPQRKIARAPRYGAPVQMTGAPAGLLALQATEQLTVEESAESVLLNTITGNLSDTLLVQYGLRVVGIEAPTGRDLK